MREFNHYSSPQGRRPSGSRQGPRGERSNPDRSQRQGGGYGGGGGDQGDSPPNVAAPWYLKDNFGDAPPGHRYLMYLPFWKQDWASIKGNKHQALKTLCEIPPYTYQTMSAFTRRQRDIGKGIGAEVVEAVSTSPFATGLGWEHPNENGFTFLHPYGLPYLGGSGVKGVVRDAARELANGFAGDAYGWTEDAVTTLFGPMPEEINKAADAFRGALRFFDVIPEIAGDGLGVDIMNPHYGDYYQDKRRDDRGREIYPDGATPNDAGSPVPIFFVVVPPGSKFTFVVDCPREHLLSNGLKSKWRDLVRTALFYAFDWLGFGAKTAVGYGAMRMVKEPQGTREQAATVPHTGKADALNPVSSDPKTETWPHAQLTWNKGKGELIASHENKRAFSVRGDGTGLFNQLSEPAQKRLGKGKPASANVTVKAEGRNWVIASVEERPT